MAKNKLNQRPYRLLNPTEIQWEALLPGLWSLWLLTVWFSQRVPWNHENGGLMLTDYYCNNHYRISSTFANLSGYSLYKKKTCCLGSQQTSLLVFRSPGFTQQFYLEDCDMPDTPFHEHVFFCGGKPGWKWNSTTLQCIFSWTDVGKVSQLVAFMPRRSQSVTISSGQLLLFWSQILLPMQTAMSICRVKEKEIGCQR